jgi:DNA repair photolyase
LSDAGCAFGADGCGVYCYVAESPIGRYGPGPWGSWVHAKTNAAARLEEELAGRSDLGGMRIFMSSATDPYQPAEARLKITRQVLEILCHYPLGLLVVQTRSPLVERDYDLLAQMPFAWLSMTIETDDDAVRKALTPTCPSIARRIRAMCVARAHGIKVQAAVSPVLPHAPERFAELLAVASGRVVVDTFIAGDGVHGRRTSRRPLPVRYKELGWGNWRDEGAARHLYQMLSEQLGPERVVWSSNGFNDL